MKVRMEVLVLQVAPLILALVMMAQEEEAETPIEAMGMAMEAMVARLMIEMKAAPAVLVLQLLEVVVMAVVTIKVTEALGVLAATATARMVG